MKGIFIVPCHDIDRERMINIDIHDIKETFDLVFKDIIRLDFPGVGKYSIKYCIPNNITSEMLSCVSYEEDNAINLINRASSTLVDGVRGINKYDYIILAFRVAKENDKLLYNQKKQNEIKKWLSLKYKIAKNKIKIYNHKGVDINYD